MMNPSSAASTAAAAESSSSILLKEEEEEEEEQQQPLLLLLKQALDRAVACGQMAPNHKRTEPFTVLRFFASSQTAIQLADICYHVTLFHKKNSNNNNNCSVETAERKRQKWLDIPAFLVTLVHDNQTTVLTTTTTTTTTTATTTMYTDDDLQVSSSSGNSRSSSSSSSSNLYQALPFVPPTTERQLEDVSNYATLHGEIVRGGGDGRCNNKER
jgi:hypothetical protein